ncbi:probable RNA-directed DNA polymerase from transposon X-element [Trichonephila clavipes]|nr:probable RNA-directed DNA polymerase from transposon X-element [Trichonephila clavipes]
MLVRLSRTPVLSGGLRRKTQLFSGTLYMAASSKTPPHQSKGGTLILVINSLKHYCLPTPPLRTLEANNIILTSPKHDPISITCVYIPPSSDENLFTIDIEHFIQTASNCILFGDFNATHNAWNCKNNTTRGRHLFNFANMLNLNIAFPSTPTRFGHNSANTIDIALIKNFYYPFTINSIGDLSSDHNPIFLNFNFKLAEALPNPRAVSTDWKAFKINLNKNLSLFDFHPNNINNTNDLEQKISEFTEAVIDTHSHASRPIETDRRNFTPHNINQLIKIKNYFRKRYHQTLNPLFKSHYNRAQSDLKKELKKYNDIIWQKRLEALNTADNSLWRTQKFFKNKRTKIPPLNCATAVMRPILAYACPVWGYAVKTNINILDTLQNSLIRMVVKAIRFRRNDDIPNFVYWFNGYVNKQNCRIWSEANPQVYVETPLHPEKLTVWCALWAGGIIGPYFFKNDEVHNATVNCDRYTAMNTNFFIPELNNNDVQELWFQQDGATCHTARATIDLLKDAFGDRLISRFGPMNWLPRSCVYHR